MLYMMYLMSKENVKGKEIFETQVKNLSTDRFPVQINDFNEFF